MQIAALICLALVGYTYVGYPMLLWLRTKLVPTNSVPTPEPATSTVTIAVIIAAYNEELYIRDRVQNLLDQKTSLGDVRIYVGSDGSSDATNSILQEFDDPRLHVGIFEERRGKSAVLNDLLDLAKDSDYLVFSDADIQFESGCIHLLVEHLLATDNVCACGHLELFDPSSGNNLDNMYWRYERTVRQLEASVHTVTSIPGALFAIETAHVTQQPEGMINDDLFQALSVLTQGHTIGYVHQAQAFGPVPEGLQEEKARRLRIGMGNYQIESAFRSQLNKFTPMAAWQYLSHKVLRWYTPHLLVLALVLSLLHWIFAGEGLLFLLQFFGYAYTFISKTLHARGKLKGVLALPLFFVEMNLSYLSAFLRFIKSDADHLWGTKRS